MTTGRSGLEVQCIPFPTPIDPARHLHNSGMARNYSMGARTSKATAAERVVHSERRSLRERFGALRNIPPFLRLVWQTSPSMMLAQSALRLVRALLPVATLYVGKLIIDEVVAARRGAASGGRSARLARHGWLDRIGCGCSRSNSALAVAVRRARAHGLAARLAAVRALQQRDQPAADGARGDARPRGLRGQRAAGQARARAPAGRGPHVAVGPVVRPGAGRRHDRELRGRASSSTRRG